MDEKEEIKKDGFKTVKDYKVVDRIKIAVDLIGKHHKVLELGCRTGEVTKLYCEDNDVTGIDFIPEFIKEAEKLKGTFWCWDLEEDLPFINNVFDVVFCGEVIEYLHNRKKCLREIHRVLKRGGRLIITEPNKFSFRRRLKFLTGYEIHEHKHFLHLFRYDELEYIIRCAGFKITKWINGKIHIKGITLPFKSKTLCDVWVVEAVKK